MKNCAIIFIFLLLLSCGNSHQETSSLEGEILLEAGQTEQELKQPSSYSDVIPVVDFEMLNEKYLTPSSDNKLYVLNFWATWCKPCVKELPYFEQLQATYNGQNIEVILVSLDFPKNIDKQVLPFIEKHNLKSTVILLDDPDANSWIPRVDKNWSGAIPATIIIKGDRKAFYEQSFTFNELEKEVQSIL